VVALQDIHPLAAADKLVLADLEGEELIWPSGEQVPALYEKLRSAWRAAGLEPDVTIEIASAEAALNAVAAGLGVAVVRESNAGREPPGVVLKVVSDLNIPLRASVCWMDRPPSQALSAFLQLLVDQHVTTLRKKP
jgi:DNA-binding transcriptional LysR family regulator